MLQRRAAAGAAVAAAAAAVSTLTAGTLLGLGGCSLLRRPSPIKMDVFFDDQACRAQAPVLLVFLPGAHMRTSELLEQGFVAAVRQRRLAVDVALADAHLGYVQDGSLLRRLEDDVLAPARAQGYRRIWLAGISLGGYAAMAYALAHPGQIEGLVCLAPYLGRRQLLQDITAAGGPAAWRMHAVPRDADDADHALWLGLSAAHTLPPLYLGYGAEDRFAQGHRLLAGLLPAERVQVLPGGHDWPPWRALWAQWLDRRLWPTACAA